MARELSSILEVGSTLAVANVQQLAASISPADIPERYLRPEAEDAPVASIDDDDIPVIDLMKLTDPELFDEVELTRLGLACREWGFFQLINHGVSKEVMEKTKIVIKEFFELPLNEKEAIKQLPGQIEGYGQMFVHSEEQKLDWGDLVVLITQPNKNMRFWPTNPTSFRDTLETYTSEIEKVVYCLYKLMSKDLGIDPQVMLKTFSNQVQSVRLNYYPPCKQANKVLGLSPHSDGIALTVLLQANDVNGLQIKKIGKWLLIKPKPGAFIINIGDMMEILTNGKYKSIEHRAVINTEEKRLSIATFHSPSRDVMLCPFSELVKSDGELYKAISMKEYAKEYFSGKLNGKVALERMKLTK